MYDDIKELVPVFDTKDMFIFLGNHKVGLTSIVRNALKDRAVSRKNSRKEYHIRLENTSEDYFKNTFKFTIIRNPFDRTVSAFFYLKRLRIVGVKKSFKEFIKTDFKKHGVSINNHFHPMFMRAKYSDFVGRMENIEKDWRIIADKIDCPIKRLPRKNRSKHMHYKKYYDKECIKIVSDIYREDFKELAYKF